MASVDRAAAVLGLAHDLEVGLALEQATHAHPEQGVVVDEQDLGDLARPFGDRGHPVADPDLGSPLRSFVLLLERDCQPYDGAPIGPGTNLKASTDQLGPLAHELQPEVAPAAGGHRADVEAPPVVAHLEDPVRPLQPGGDRDALGRGVLADVLEGFLDDPQDDRLVGLAELLAAGLDLGARPRSRSGR